MDSIDRSDGGGGDGGGGDDGGCGDDSSQSSGDPGGDGPGDGPGSSLMPTFAVSCFNRSSSSLTSFSLCTSTRPLDATRVSWLSVCLDTEGLVVAFSSAKVDPSSGLR